MLTDDDLTRQLGTAFRAATDDLTYRGRVPTPRRPAYVLAVPAAATVAAAAVLVTSTGAPSGDPTGPRATPTHRTPGSGGPSAGAVVTDEIEVAGFTLEYQRTVGEPDPIRLVTDTEVPGDARSLEVDGPAKAWIGTDPASGDAALWLESPIRNGGRLFALESSVWTQDQLLDLFHHGSPS
ncbi:MAG TPA: hypothetical protein VD864_11845 [Nocardioides sp.]|nr:hypothetical protein [Nocardioides sp.]